ncbi:hypothetical protein PCANC_28572 [Puccinia coronata f. sp. avenae]|uniref:Secreted protein n=1 Tax=Puccinia coronata f. sp. avenae TaxID=200324 RepID=A0A2N5RTZ2_9BASI|nr:hypothetical protein PCANC_28572 [Puccinia coronata f. sp. avenae]
MRSYIIALGSLMITVIVNIDPASAFNCANIKAPNGKTPAHAAACKVDSNYYSRAEYISKHYDCHLLGGKPSCCDVATVNSQTTDKRNGWIYSISTKNTPRVNSSSFLSSYPFFSMHQTSPLHYSLQ